MIQEIYSLQVNNHKIPGLKLFVPRNEDRWRDDRKTKRFLLKNKRNVIGTTMVCISIRNQRKEYKRNKVSHGKAQALKVTGIRIQLHLAHGKVNVFPRRSSFQTSEIIKFRWPIFMGDQTASNIQTKNSKTGQEICKLLQRIRHIKYYILRFPKPTESSWRLPRRRWELARSTNNSALINNCGSIMKGTWFI